MSNNQSNDIPAAPFGCKFQNASLSYNTGIFRSTLLYVLIAVTVMYVGLLTYIYVFDIHLFSPDEDHHLLFDSNVIAIQYSIWGLFIVMAILFSFFLYFKSRYGTESGSLDKEGFQYHEDNSFSFLTSSFHLGDHITLFTKKIPLCNILKFRLQRDVFGAYVEIVTTDKPFHICRSARETRIQKWLVAAGNTLLTNLTGKECSNLEIPEESREIAEDVVSLSDTASQSITKVRTAPFGCQFRDYFLMYFDYGIYRALIFMPIVLLLLFAISRVFWVSSVSELYWVALLYPSIFFVLFQFFCTKKTGYLDEKGFHFLQTAIGGGVIGTTPTDIPLSKIRRFCIHNDENGSFVEIVTKDGPFRFCRSLFRCKQGTKTQRWLVDAGNAVLSNLKGRDCSDSKQTLVRLSRDELLDDVEKPESTDWQVQKESDRITFKHCGKYSSTAFHSMLFIVLLGLFLCLAACVLSVYLQWTPKEKQSHTLLFILIDILFPIVSVFVLIKYSYSFLNALLVLFSYLKSQQWTFTAKNAVRVQKLFGITRSSHEFDLTHFSHMDILTDDLYHIVLFDENDGIICEFNDLNENDAYWIANEIQQIL